MHIGTPQMALQLVSAAVVGLVAGTLFFAMLWLTVRRLPEVGHPHLLLLGSFFGRAAIVLGAFYWLSTMGLGVVLAAAAGFLAARTLAVRRLAPKARPGR